MPISFTRYTLTNDRLFIKTGFLTTVQEEILLYRVRDLTFRQTIGQKIFRVGSVIIHAADKTDSICELKNIKKPMETKELIYQNVEMMKQKNRVRSSEYISDMESGDIDDEEYPDD